ncbi:MAG: protein hupE [Rhodopseudomonas sp.]|nr:protein hupE [Rhodopseudomonas sp.]
MKRLSPVLAAVLAGALVAPVPAFAHIGPHAGLGSTASFAAGIAHPLSGLDHIAVMVAVGLWAALKGGRALWLWPVTFVGVMLVGGALGMAHVAIPFVEPGILASVVALGLLVALAVDLPVAVGAAIVGVFAVFHGHAHGSEVAENIGGIEYMAGFAVATATLHMTGIAFALAASRAQLRPAIRVAGALCVAVGAGLIGGVI